MGKYGKTEERKSSQGAFETHDKTFEPIPKAKLAWLSSGRIRQPSLNPKVVGVSRMDPSGQLSELWSYKKKTRVMLKCERPHGEPYWEQREL